MGAVFLGVRLLLLYARDPFFDELFTLWMARQPLSHVIPNLLHDSGPPLYYFLARLDSIAGLRLLSLFFAALQFALVVRRSILAAALLAVYPPAVLLSVDARAYALCALLVTIALLALESDRPFLAAFVLVLAAYSHYYGVLFFPLLLLGPPRRRVPAFVAVIVLFTPGFILASQQPVEATKWIHESALAPLLNFSMAGRYPDALMTPAPLPVIIAAVVVMIIALARSARFAPAVIVPIVLVIALQLAGRPAYFPLRFESVIAAPLMLWAASSLERYPRVWRRVLAGTLIALGALTLYAGIIDHLNRPVDPRHAAALALRNLATPHDQIVATGYCYLETLVALNRPIQAWPPDQAEHPGWRSFTRPDPRTLPPGPFVWIGERLAPELPVLRGVRPVRPLFLNETVLVARAEGLTPPVH